MKTPDMINHIRANNQPLSQRVLRAIADRLEEQDSHLRSALATLTTQMEVVAGQEEQLRGLGGELAESEAHRRILVTQNRELLARVDLLTQELADARSLASEARVDVSRVMIELSNISQHSLARADLFDLGQVDQKDLVAARVDVNCSVYGLAEVLQRLESI